MKHLLIVFDADKPKDDENYRLWDIDEKLFGEIRNSKSGKISLNKVDYEVVEKRWTKQILIIDVRLP